MKKFKILSEYIVLFLTGGLLYMCIEMLWRGRTDITSFFMGGIALIVVGQLNEGYTWDIPLTDQMLLSGVFITAMEYVVGVMFNSDHHIWDYRELAFNIDGQICLWYFLLWCLLSLLGIFLDDFIRWKFFDEEKPRYSVI